MIKCRDRRALIINFSGIGNGIMTLPILKCIEKQANRIAYYHNANPILFDKWFINKIGLKKLLGIVPAEWRRFKREGWKDICAFIETNNIELIINMRNEGEEYDKGYYQFRKLFKNELEFWELDFAGMRLRKRNKLLVHDILLMLRRHKIDVSDYDPHWLKGLIYKKDETKKRIGFYTGTSRINKRWPVDNWRKLGGMLLQQNNDNLVELYSGISNEEKKITSRIIEFIRYKYSKRCHLITNKTLAQLAYKFGHLDILVSNDTFAVHLATALDIPTIGIYFSTDPTIWGENSNKFTALHADRKFICKKMKPIAGNCLHFYGRCPASRYNGISITPQQVFKAIYDAII